MGRIFADLNSNQERQLAKEIFDLYMSSSNRSEYYGKVKKKSDECGKTGTYLKELRKIYADMYATDEEKKLYSLKKSSMKSEIPSFVRFCDDLFGVSRNKRCEYLKLKNVSLSIVRDNFDRYRKHGGKYETMLDEFYKEYSIFVAKSNYRKERIRVKKKYQKNCEFFDGLVEKGFYSITDYLDYMDSIEPGHRKDNCTLFNSWKREIKDYDIEKWEEYRNKMKINKINALILMKEKIAEFIGMLVTKYRDGASVDIIDYYLIVGIPFKKFKDISSDYLSDAAKALFNRFISSYVEIDGNYYGFDSLSKINYSNSEVDITEEEKIHIVEFLRENNIPTVYFPVALNKYLKGDLDIKFKSLKKEI